MLFTVQHAVQASPYVHLDVFGYSESVPIVNAIDKWDGPFVSGTEIYSHDLIEVGAVADSWSIGILKRYDYELKFSEDASEFYYRINNKLDLDPGRVYDLEIDIHHSYSEGVRVGYKNKLFPNLKFNFGAAYLHGIELTDGYISGSATALATNDYDFQFDVSYVYSEDSLFDRDVNKPSGHGLAFDLSLDWTINDKLYSKLEVKDLFSFIRWYDAPFTTAVTSSDTKSFDENGFVVYQPVVKGLEGNRDFNQKLPVRGELLGGYKMQRNLSLLAAFNFNSNFNYYQFGADYTFSAGNKLELMYATTLKALSIEYVGDSFRLGFVSDTLKLSDARTLGLIISFNKSI